MQIRNFIKLILEILFSVNPKAHLLLENIGV